MQALTIRLDDDLHAKAKAKAEYELRSLNAVVNRLVEKWVAGEVGLEPPETGPGTKEKRPEQE
jgi:predicted transcriptional regulator